MKQTEQQPSPTVHYYEPGIKHYQEGRHKNQSSQQRMYDWLMRLLAFVMIGFSMLFLLLSVKTHFNTAAVVTERQQVEQSVESEEKGLKSLKNEATLLKDDDYVMKLARSRYYMSKDDEVIFSTPEDNASDQAKQLNPQQNQQ
ncbi:MAG: septum formation initiator family protein [Aerococcus sp.]|nr:septum formation initiator family protein [Aerococcus sp.]